MQDQALQPWQSPCPGAAWPQGPSGEVSQPLRAIQTLSPRENLGQQSAAGGSCPTSARLLPKGWVLPADRVLCQCQQQEKGQTLCVILPPLFQPGIVLSMPLEVTGGTAAAACGVAESQNVRWLCLGGDVGAGHEVLALLAAHPDSLAIVLREGCTQSRWLPAAPCASGSFYSLEWERRGLDWRLCKDLPQMWVHLFCLYTPALRRRRGRAYPPKRFGSDRAEVSLSSLELLREPGRPGQFHHRHHSASVGFVMTPGALGLVCGGKQEDALRFLWCALCREAEEELGLCPSSSLTDVVKNNTGNPNIHYSELRLLSWTVTGSGCGLMGAETSRGGSGLDQS